MIFNSGTYLFRCEMRLNLFLQKDSIGALRCVGSIVYSVFVTTKIFLFLSLFFFAPGLDLSVSPIPVVRFSRVGHVHYHGVLYHDGYFGQVCLLFVPVNGIVACTLKSEFESIHLYTRYFRFRPNRLCAVDFA